MITNGVSKSGETIDVVNDFSLHVPFEWCYDIDEYATNGAPVLKMFLPSERPLQYKAGRFLISDDETNNEVVLDFNSIGKVTVADDATEMDIDIENVLKQQSEKAKNVTLGLNIGDESTEFGTGGFHRLYKVVKNDPFLKVGYYTSGIFGKAVFNILIFTSHHVYAALNCNFASSDIRNCEKTLSELLSTMKPLNVKEYQVSEEQIAFAQPLYSDGNKVQVGPLSIMLPDGYIYVSKDHIPADDDRAESALGDYEMVAAPSDWKGGLRNYRDAVLGINLSEPKQTGIDDNAWNDVSRIKESLNSNEQGHKFTYVKQGFRYLIAYGRGNECEKDDEPYWVVYFVTILCGSLQYTCNLYFNSQKAKPAEYVKAMETFCSKIQVITDNISTVEGEKLREELGDMLADNGRLDGILATHLYTKDIIFNNDNEVFYDGEHTVITGFQINASVMGEYPRIVNHSKAVIRELRKVIEFVEQNENLMIPKSKFHPNILKATRGNPITGTTIFEFCAWHMLLIAEMEENRYTVAIDNNLIKGIPDAFLYFGEFIKTLRAFNEIHDDFEITYESTLNADGPCGNITSPVRGAVTDGKRTITVKGGSDEEIKTYSKRLKEQDSIAEDEYVCNEIKKLESRIDWESVVGLKSDAKEVKELFHKVSEAIKCKDFAGLNDIDAVIERVNEAVDQYYDYNSFRLSYLYRPFVNSYELAFFSQRVISDADFDGLVRIVISENTFVRGEFDPNEFPKNLCAQMDSLTENEIYRQLLVSANHFIDEGNRIISKLSAEYIQKQLVDFGSEIEAQGTQHEGRIDRIERISDGEKLELQREPNNEYDSNSIDIRTPDGSVGHLPADIAKLLSPAIDEGTIEVEAEVARVEPLSKRSSRAKKPLLYVRITVKKREASVFEKKDSEKDIKRIKEEEAKKKKAQIAEAKKQAEEKRKQAVESEALELASLAKQSYKKLESDWRVRLDNHQTRVSYNTYHSVDEVIRDMREIVLDRNHYGMKYDELIADVHKQGRKLVDKGCSVKGVCAIRDAITEIIEESTALDIDFSTTGMTEAEIGTTEFSVSDSSIDIQRWWNSIYDGMLVAQADKEKEHANESKKNEQSGNELTQEIEKLDPIEKEKLEEDRRTYDETHIKWEKECERSKRKINWR